MFIRFHKITKRYSSVRKYSGSGAFPGHKKTEALVTCFDLVHWKIIHIILLDDCFTLSFALRPKYLPVILLSRTEKVAKFKRLARNM